MTTVALVIAAVALAGVVFLAFGYSALLVLVRDLQDALDGYAGPAPRSISRFAGDRRSFVLVVEPNCASCRDRIADLAEHARANAVPSSLSLILLQAAPGPPKVELPAEVEFVSDAALVGELAVGVVPLGLVFETTGKETARAVLGDRASFARLIGWADSGAAHNHAELIGRD